MGKKTKPNEPKVEEIKEPAPLPVEPAPAQEPRVISIVDMGVWSARVFSDARVERVGQPGIAVADDRAIEVLRRLVIAQHRELCPSGCGAWVGGKTAFMSEVPHETPFALAVDA